MGAEGNGMSAFECHEVEPGVWQLTVGDYWLGDVVEDRVYGSELCMAYPADGSSNPNLYDGVEAAAEALLEHFRAAIPDSLWPVARSA